jgi:predicted enzyme related to lactoylglutathione lyase
MLTMKKNLFILFLLSSIIVWSNPFKTDEAKVENVIWHDLITPNLEESKWFYGDLFGWSYQTFNVKGFKYALIENKGEVIGGMIEVSTTKSSVWVSSLSVSPQEMRKRVETITASGAQLVIKPLKIPGRGKQLIFKGLQGETFSLITDNNQIVKTKNSDKNGNWYGIELWANDIKKAKDFYKKAFNVDSKEEDFDNKPYNYFMLNDVKVGGLIKNPLTNMDSQWIPYLNIKNLNDIVEKVSNLKGEVILSPNKNIRNGSIGIIQDSFGAILCIQKK